MDIYTQLQDKLNDIALRISHEARYFQDISLEESSTQDGRSRLPLIQDTFVENEASLALRAQCSANALVTLNLQLDRLLGTLPENEGEEEAQLEVLEQLVEENVVAGEMLQEEAASAEAILAQVREAVRVIGDDRSRDALQQLSIQMELAARGLKPAERPPPPPPPSSVVDDSMHDLHDAL